MSDRKASKIRFRRNKKEKEDLNTTPYQLAHSEWDERVGSAKVQARNWRLACMITLVVVLLLLICIIMQLNSQQRYVYVAEVKPQENVVNVRPMSVAYIPTTAQKEAFVANFIRKIMTIPLDPVVLRNQWLVAYKGVTGKAIIQLNNYVKLTRPFMNIGKLTKTVAIIGFNKLGNNSYEVTWSLTTINLAGKTTSVLLYSGVFTFVKSKPPKLFQEMLINPLGLRIGYFSFGQKGASQ